MRRRWRRYLFFCCCALPFVLVCATSSFVLAQANPTLPHDYCRRRSRAFSIHSFSRIPRSSNDFPTGGPVSLFIRLSVPPQVFFQLPCLPGFTMGDSDFGRANGGESCSCSLDLRLFLVLCRSLITPLGAGSTLFLKIATLPDPSSSSFHLLGSFPLCCPLLLTWFPSNQTFFFSRREPWGSAGC